MLPLWAWGGGIATSEVIVKANGLSLIRAGGHAEQALRHAAKALATTILATAILATTILATTVLATTILLLRAAAGIS